jgi:hypothetical protein
LRYQHTIVIAVAAVCAACGGGDGGFTPDPVPQPDTIRTVTGTIGHHSTGPRLSNLDANGRLLAEPGLLESTLPAGAARIPVEVLDLNGTVMGTGLSDATGRYSVDVNFGQNPATQLIIRAKAVLTLPFAQVRVLPNASASEPYAHQTPPSGDPSEREMRIDLTVDLGDGAAAYRMLTVLYPGFTEAAQGIVAGEIPDIDIYWEPGNGPESSFDGSRSDLGRITVAGGITGDPTSNTDCWDESVVVRLLGEYLLHYFFLVSEPEGDGNDARLVPSAAWKEGFLDFWSCVARGTSLYWDTVGSGAQGRVTRYFDIESFFDPTLGSLGPDDPNVYQPDSVVGIGSRFSIAEVLWDIHDTDRLGDRAGLDYPLFLTLRLLDVPKAGEDYPYFVTLLEAYDADASISAVTLDVLLEFPEDQEIPFLEERYDELVWPRWFSPGNVPGDKVGPGYSGTLSDTVDTVNPDPINYEIGEETQRYFIVHLDAGASVTATLSTAGDLIVEIMDLNNSVIATGTPTATANSLTAGRYVIRARPRDGADPQVAPFDLTVSVNAP